LDSYEWQVLMMNRWLPYKPSIGRKLEALFRYTSRDDRDLLRHIFKRNWWRDNSAGENLTCDYEHYRICPLFMLQRNMRTGKKREIRRQKIVRHYTPTAIQKYYPHHGVQYSHEPLLYKTQVHGKVMTSTCDSRRKMTKVRSRHATPRFKRGTADKNIFRNNKHRGSKQVQQNFDADSSSSVVTAKSRDGLNKFKNITRWSIKEIVNWLRTLNLEMYSKVFQDNAVTGWELSSADLQFFVKDLGIPEEQAKQLFNALQLGRFVSEQEEANSFTRDEALKSVASSSVYPLYASKRDPIIGGGKEEYSQDICRFDESSWNGAEREDCTLVEKPRRNLGRSLATTPDIIPASDNESSIEEIAALTPLDGQECITPRNDQDTPTGFVVDPIKIDFDNTVPLHDLNRMAYTSKSEGTKSGAYSALNHWWSSTRGAKTSRSCNTESPMNNYPTPPMNNYLSPTVIRFCDDQLPILVEREKTAPTLREVAGHQTMSLSEPKKECVTPTNSCSTVSSLSRHKLEWRPIKRVSESCHTDNCEDSTTFRDSSETSKYIHGEWVSKESFSGMWHRRSHKSVVDTKDQNFSDIDSESSTESYGMKPEAIKNLRVNIGHQGRKKVINF